MNDSRSQREELKRFLKTRRAGIHPHAAGVFAVGRRRTTGLTREDVAHLAGVSFKWYTLFESGAASGVSRRFLERIAGVLQLNRVERSHLFALVGFADTADDGDEPVVPEHLRRLVDELTGAPAVVYSSLFDVLHCNTCYDHLFHHSEQPPDFRSNKLWRLYLDPDYRALWPAWEGAARRVAAELRYLNRLHTTSPRYQALLQELSRSPDFERFWNASEVHDLGENRSRFELEPPGAGLLTFDISTLVPSDNPRLFFAALIPTDTATRTRLKKLVDGAASRGSQEPTPRKAPVA
ncbi:MAG: helix-turn-helix transcriptional regulator [Nevskia sp.]|nr:helix-turn-helix transcriptional regulator [Nevskia sp.]